MTSDPWSKVAASSSSENQRRGRGAAARRLCAYATPSALHATRSAPDLPAGPVVPSTNRLPDQTPRASPCQLCAGVSAAAQVVDRNLSTFLANRHLCRRHAPTSWVYLPQPLLSEPATDPFATAEPPNLSLCPPTHTHPSASSQNHSIRAKVRARATLRGVGVYAGQ